MINSARYEFYTPDQLSQEWSDLTGSNITTAMIFQYGKDDNLIFMVANPDDNEVRDVELGDDYIETWCKEFGYGQAKYFTINPTQLNHILLGKSLRLDSCMELIDGRKVEFFLSPDIAYEYDKSSLVISKKEVIKFENKYFKKYGQDGKDQEPLPSWRDLFTNPATKQTEVFTNVCSAVTQYIEDNKKLPSRDQLWEQLKLQFTYDLDKKSITNIAWKDMDKGNFRSDFNRWTKIKPKTE